LFLQDELVRSFGAARAGGFHNSTVRGSTTVKTKATIRRNTVTATLAGLIALGSGISFAGSDNANSSSVTHDINPVINPYSPAYGHPYRHGVVPTAKCTSR
jgi:hypothetical protein